MRILRGRCRLLLSRTPHLVSTVKILSLVSIILFVFFYVQEKQEKEALIDLALGNRNTIDLVKPDNDTLIINGVSTQEGNLEERKHQVKNAFVVIIVTSLPGNKERRKVIRETWAKAADQHGARVVFFMGNPPSNAMMNDLIKESRQYQDLIVDDFMESYYALAVKTLRIIKYFKIHHPKSKFLVKTDDDVFVNVSNLIYYCYSVNKQFSEKPEYQSTPDYFLGGVIHSDRGPHVWNSYSKWYAPEYVWKPVFERAKEQLKTKTEDYVKASESVGAKLQKTNEPTDIANYPPYAEGNFYVLSSDAALDILNVSKTVPLYHLEDIHVTGVLATWMLKIDKTVMPFISSSSNFFPKLSYYFFKMFTASAKDIIAFHCDNYIELISIIYNEALTS